MKILEPTVGFFFRKLTRYDEIKTVKRMAVNSLARGVENSEKSSDISLFFFSTGELENLRSVTWMKRRERWRWKLGRTKNEGGKRWVVSYLVFSFGCILLIVMTAIWTNSYIWYETGTAALSLLDPTIIVLQAPCLITYQKDSVLGSCFFLFLLVIWGQQLCNNRTGEEYEIPWVFFGFLPK